MELHHGSMYRESGVASGFLFLWGHKRKTPLKEVFSCTDSCTHLLSNIQKITCITLRNLFGLDLFSHQSCATGTLLLQKKIYPRKSSLNLKQLIFFHVPKSLKINDGSGDGRSRTAVQTTHQEAFYTFSRPLVVGRGLPEDGLTEAYPLGLGRI